MMINLRLACDYIQLVALFVVIQFGNGMTEGCPGPAELYIKRGPNLMCRKYYNCEPGYEILPCQNQCEPEQCVQCQEGMKQMYLIHSDSSEEDRKCFKPQSVCSDKEIIVTQSQTVCDSKPFCECDVYNCHYGNPCICNKQVPECQENEYLVVHNMKNAECLPCPPGTYKPERGCQPCRVNVEIIIQKVNSSTSATVTSIPSTQHQVTTTTGQQLLTSTVVQTTQKSQNGEKIPVDLIIGLAVSGVVVSLIAIILCCVIRKSRRCQICMDAHVCCEQQLMLPLHTEETDASTSETDVKMNHADDVNQNSVPQSPMEETQNPLPFHPDEKKPGDFVVQTETMSNDTVSDDQVSKLIPKLTLLKNLNLESTPLNQPPHVSQESSMGQVNQQDDKKEFKVSIDMNMVNGLMNTDSQLSDPESSILNMIDKGQENEEDTERKLPVGLSVEGSSGYKSTLLHVPSDSSISYIDIKGSGKCKEESEKFIAEQGSPDENTKLLDQPSAEVDSHESCENEEETQPKLLYEKEDSMKDNIK